MAGGSESPVLVLTDVIDPTADLVVAELDGKPLEHVTPMEFETSPGPHHLVVVGATGAWPQDFVAATGGTHAFHAVLPAAKRAATAVTTSSVVRTTTSAPDRTSLRAGMLFLAGPMALAGLFWLWGTWDLDRDTELAPKRMAS